MFCVCALSTIALLRETHISRIITLTPLSWTDRLRRVMATVISAGSPEVVGAFQEHLAHERMLSGNTVKRYVRVIGRFALFLSPTRENAEGLLAKATKDDVVRFLREQQRGFAEPSRATWNNHLAA